MIVAVEFEWEDGHTKVVEYPSIVRGLRYKGKRPTKLSVCVTTHDVKVVEWINECHFALESSD